ncbi:MAG TPA: prohibitin family protein [Membranihabitans sp.]|nr:prohibitin family protein [Membranihabitans sp.]
MIANNQNRNSNNSGINMSGLTKWIFLGILGIVLISVLSSSTFLTIDAGNRGVLFKRFGGGLVMDQVYDQGFHIVPPWNKMNIYNVRIQEDYETMETLSRNGLNIKVELSYLYRPIIDKLPQLHDEIGVDYAESILKPELRSATREVIGKYLPEELYSSKREDIQSEIFDQTSSSIIPKHIYLDAVLIREVKLPESLEQAIERKLKEEQSSLEYEFRLEREEKEAQRILIAAKAQAEANRVISSSLDNQVLRDKGISATLELANSQNAKIIVIGSGEDGLPLILGNQ